MKLLWIFDHDAIMAIPLLSGALWALGGAGPKWIRRFILPAVLGLSAFTLGFPWWASGLSSALLCVFTTLPYGQGMKNKLGWLYSPYLFIIGALYAISPFALLGLKAHWILAGILPAISGALFAFLTLGSQKGFIPWKIVEMAVGLMIGFSFLFAF